MSIHSNATPMEIRHELGGANGVDVDYLVDAVMVLCKRVAELESKVDRNHKAAVVHVDPD